MKILGDPGNGYRVNLIEAMRFLLLPFVWFVAAVVLSIVWRLIAVDRFGMRPVPPSMAMLVFMAAYAFFGLPEEDMGEREAKPRPLRLRLLEVAFRFVPLAAALVAHGAARVWR